MKAATAKRRALQFILAVACLLYGTAANAEVGPPVAPDKKLIAWAADVVQSADLEEAVQLKCSASQKRGRSLRQSAS